MWMAAGRLDLRTSLFPNLAQPIAKFFSVSPRGTCLLYRFAQRTPSGLLQCSPRSVVTVKATGLRFGSGGKSASIDRAESVVTTAVSELTSTVWLTAPGGSVNAALLVAPGLISSGTEAAAKPGAAACTW